MSLFGISHHSSVVRGKELKNQFHSYNKEFESKPWVEVCKSQNVNISLSNLMISRVKEGVIKVYTSNECKLKE